MSLNRPPGVIDCYLIDINPAALAADTVSAMDFNGNTFTVAKTLSINPVLGTDTLSVTDFTGKQAFTFTMPNRYNDSHQQAYWESNSNEKLDTNRIWESNSNSIGIMNFGVKTGHETGPSSGPNLILGHY